MHTNESVSPPQASIDRFPSIEALFDALEGSAAPQGPGMVRVNAKSLPHSHGKGIGLLRTRLLAHGFALITTSRIPVGEVELWRAVEAKADVA